LDPTSSVSPGLANTRSFLQCTAKEKLDTCAISYLEFTMKEGAPCVGNFTALSQLPTNGSTLLIVTAQASTKKVRELSNRKRLCKKGGGMSVTSWSDALEAELKLEQKRTNVGRCIVYCGGDSS